MLLDQGRVDTRDHGIGGKFDSDMAVYLDHLWLNGDRGEDQATHGVLSEGCARYGKWMLLWLDNGFVYATKFDTEEDAEEEMRLRHDLYEQEDA